MSAARMVLALVPLLLAAADTRASALAPAHWAAIAEGTSAILAGRKPAPPLKDCTPWNGRGGFYGNIFCSEREREAWERRGRRLSR